MNETEKAMNSAADWLNDVFGKRCAEDRKVTVTDAIDDELRNVIEMMRSLPSRSPQPAEGEAAPGKLPKISVELPRGDNRKITYWFTSKTEDGWNICIDLDESAELAALREQLRVAGEIGDKMAERLADWEDECHLALSRAELMENSQKVGDDWAAYRAQHQQLQPAESNPCPVCEQRAQFAKSITSGEYREKGKGEG